MANAARTTHFRFWLWLIALISVIVPRRLRADWRRDRRELFYYSGDGKLMAAPVRSGENFETDAAVSLFEFRAGTLLPTISPYAVTADGQRFLINTVVDTEPNAPLTLVVNWAVGVKK